MSTAAGKKPERDNAPAAVDTMLVARMTGRLGDRQTIEAKAGALAAQLCEPLAVAIRRATGLTVKVGKGSVETGLRSEFEAKGVGNLISCSAGIHGWCHDFSLATSPRLAIAFAESLLGGGGDAVGKRPPTAVELDISIILFDEALTVLKHVVGAEDAAASTGAPAIAAPRAKDDETPDAHAVLISLQMDVRGVDAAFAFLLPQAVILKTEIATPPPEDADTPSNPPEWTKRLSRQVSASQVTLKGHISLEPSTLGTVSRLRPGAVLAFAGGKDVQVRLEANGREIGSCELGRSGNRYMLRLKQTESFEDELIRNATA